jgi:hypothetical protein
MAPTTRPCRTDRYEMIRILMRTRRLHSRVTLPGLTQNRGMTMLKILHGPTNRPAAPRNGNLLTRQEGL